MNEEKKYVLMTPSELKRVLASYWLYPKDTGNRPEAYLAPHNWLRTIQLCNVITELIHPEMLPSVLELGCNCGRNLAMLHFAGYTDLAGIELNPDAIALMSQVFPFSKNWYIVTGDIYEIPAISKHDIVFTMAFLEHLPDERIFPIIEGAVGNYLITAEDERSSGDRHFPRRYDKVFSELRQIRKEPVHGLGKGFVLRVFKRRK